MKRIVLISCVNQKLEIKSKVKELYISPLFKYNLKYAQSLNPDMIFVLSAKYGLLRLDEKIESYNDTLNTKTVKEIKNWAYKVIIELDKEIDLRNDEVTFLAGEKYRKFLIPYIENYKVPMYGLPIGKQLKYLKEITK